MPVSEANDTQTLVIFICTCSMSLMRCFASFAMAKNFSTLFTAHKRQKSMGLFKLVGFDQTLGSSLFTCKFFNLLRKFLVVKLVLMLRIFWNLFLVNLQCSDACDFPKRFSDNSEKSRNQVEKQNLLIAQLFQWHKHCFLDAIT